MKGGKKALWQDTLIADDLMAKTKDYIEQHQAEPFFLFISTNDIHAPRLPNPRFKGATTLSYRGDNVVQLDWCVGEVRKMLEAQGLADNTLIIFSSDNGPVYIDGGYQDESDQGDHQAAGIYRGGKYQIYEGGTRVPFIVWWPSVIQPQVSDALVTQVDLLASFAHFLDLELPEGAAPDSRNYWDTFMGKDSQGAEVILEQTNTERIIALRKGPYKYIDKLEGTNELYNLEEDPQETTDLLLSNPQMAEELGQDLKQLRQRYLHEFYEIGKEKGSEAKK